MKRILIIGSTGQIGTELTVALRACYGNEHVVAGHLPSEQPLYEIRSGGPVAIADVLRPETLIETVKRHKIDTIFNLAAILSAVAEEKPRLAWSIGVDGLYNVLEIARQEHCALFSPSSIGAFGKETPAHNTPQDTLQRPSTLYGITKVTGELLCDYYHLRYGVDTRSVRFPGLISNVTLPGGGTTDYAVELFYAAVKGEKFYCPISEATYMDMMYMPDALRACIELMEADPMRLKHRNAFNITAMSLSPELLFAEVRKHIPTFEAAYRVDPVRQAIAESWPDHLDDTCAREEWGWKPEFQLDRTAADMIAKLSIKLKTA